MNGKFDDKLHQITREEKDQFQQGMRVDLHQIIISNRNTLFICRPTASARVPIASYTILRFRL